MSRHVTAEVLERMAFTTGKTIYMRGNTGYLRVAGVLFVAPIGGAA
jgi:hypothetical protein